MTRNQTHTIEVRGSGIDQKRVAAYLPSNFRVVGERTDENGKTIIEATGYDDAGWTFEDYVKPRLASGNMFANCVTPNHEY